MALWSSHFFFDQCAIEAQPFLAFVELPLATRIALITLAVGGWYQGGTTERITLLFIGNRNESTKETITNILFL